MHESWKPILKSEFDQPYFKELSKFLTDAYEHKTIYPPKQQVFSAFTTDLNDIKVVIIGQDPYHGPRQANGLAFSVHSGVQIPPSLQNIFKEINADVGAPIPNNGDPEHIIKYLNENRPHLVFILWGRDARSKKPMIDQTKHYIIESAHPSPLSAYNGFFGSKPFSKCNNKLKEWGMEEIKW